MARQRASGFRHGVATLPRKEGMLCHASPRQEPRDFRRPESVLVVIYTPDLDCLVLERASPRGFWQSVTGTLRWGESQADAAVREVREETGIECNAPTAGDTVAGSSALLVDASIARRFPILPQWRDRYAPGVTENVEHLWYLQLPEPSPVTLNAEEHTAFEWVGLDEAIGRVASWTNREALERLR